MRYPPALLCLVLTCGLVSGEEKFRFPVAKQGDAELRFINSIPVLTVQGTPAEMGSAIGALAVKPGSRLLGYPRDLLKHRRVELLWNTFLGSGRTMYKQFPSDYQEEIEAMAKSAGADRDLLIAGNTFFDLKKVFACSALLAAPSGDGHCALWTARVEAHRAARTQGHEFAYPCNSAPNRGHHVRAIPEADTRAARARLDSLQQTAPHFR